MISLQSDMLHLGLVADDVLPDLVNLGVDDAELPHPQHPRHGLGLHRAKIRVVNSQLSSNQQSRREYSEYN